MITNFEELTPKEIKRLEDLETHVRSGVEAIYLAAEALREIAGQQLYRYRSLDWGEYVKITWGMTPGRASTIMAASDVADALTKAGLERPPTIEQASALYYFRDAEMHRPVVLWSECMRVCEEVPSPAAIRQIGLKLFPKERAADRRMDHDDKPKVLRSTFVRNEPLKMAQMAKRLIKAIQGAGPRISPWLDNQSMWVEALEIIATEMMDATPYQTCPQCKSQQADCEACRGTGHMPQVAFDEFME